MSGPDLYGLKLNVVQYFMYLYFMFIKPVSVHSNTEVLHKSVL